MGESTKQLFVRDCAAIPLRGVQNGPIHSKAVDWAE